VDAPTFPCMPVLYLCPLSVLTQVSDLDLIHIHTRVSEETTVLVGLPACMFTILIALRVWLTLRLLRCRRATKHDILTERDPRRIKVSEPIHVLRGLY
jgi:hypothetical protein